MAQTPTTAVPAGPARGRTSTTRRPSAGEGTRHRHAGRRGLRITLPLIGMITLPPPERIAYYTALGVLTAFRVIDWPVALIIGLGHFLAAQHISRALQAIGQAAEAV